MGRMVIERHDMLNRSKKEEVIVIEDDGLTLKGDIKFGPIPWDCICDVTVFRILLEKHMIVSITNIPKLESIFGTKVTQKKVSKKRKSGERAIFVKLDGCELRGIDLETRIKERITGVLDDSAID
jgi:hypothetical protein